MLDMTKIDFPKRLRENAHLLALLSHYAQLGSEDRTIWQDRLMQMEEVEPKELTVLHGELIAFDWIDQNTGHAVGRPDGTISACYRITQNGLREVRRLQGIEVVEEQPETTEKTVKASPKFSKKKKVKNEPQAVAASESSNDSVAGTLRETVIPCDDQLIAMIDN